MAGIHAWLRAANLIPALLISLFAWAGFGMSFLAVLTLTLLLLVAYPICRMIYGSPAPETTAEPQNSRAERERVLKMLEDGRITAEECSELLNALGHVNPPQTTQTGPATPHRKLVLTGLALILVGFFLPWFNLNLGNELSAAMGSAPQSMPGFLNRSVFLAGGDMPHGLGWCVLLLGRGGGLVALFCRQFESPNN